MLRLNAYLTRSLLGLRDRLSRDDGLEAMEYLILAVCIGGAAVVAYFLAGARIMKGVSDLLNQLFPNG